MEAITKELKARSKKLEQLLPGELLKGHKQRSIKASRKRSRQLPIPSYNGLDGEWLDWLEVATRYEVKVPSQDKDDIRHNIILELALARAKTAEPIPIYRAYRIASYVVADYYRQQRKLNTGLDCQNCSKAKRAECKKHDLYGQCPKLIKLLSLDAETIGPDGSVITLRDTIADDKAIDLDLWLDSATFLLGCPIRLVRIAYLLQSGQSLTKNEQNYLYHFRNRQLKKHQISLF